MVGPQRVKSEKITNYNLLYAVMMESAWSFLNKLKVGLLYDSDILLLGIFHKYYTLKERYPSIQPLSKGSGLKEWVIVEHIRHDSG